VVAKVDRLTRSVGFLSRLLEAGVDARFADLPQNQGPTGRFMLQQMASVTELEAGMISTRTRAALAAAKARGQKLGGARVRRSEGKRVLLSAAAWKAGTAVLTARALARAADIVPTIEALRDNGITTLRAIATALNEAGISTPRGTGKWFAVRSSKRCRGLKAAARPGSRSSETFLPSRYVLLRFANGRNRPLAYSKQANRLSAVDGVIWIAPN
jgi:hypothetical protein